jgi:hypothetical protein
MGAHPFVLRELELDQAAAAQLAALAAKSDRAVLLSGPLPFPERLVYLAENSLVAGDPLLNILLHAGIIASGGISGFSLWLASFG